MSPIHILSVSPCQLLLLVFLVLLVVAVAVAVAAVVTVVEWVVRRVVGKLKPLLVIKNNKISVPMAQEMSMSLGPFFRSVSVSNFVLPPRSGGAVVGCHLGVVSQMICRKSKRNHWLVINQRNEQIKKLPMAQTVTGLDMVGLRCLVG